MQWFVIGKISKVSNLDSMKSKLIPGKTSCPSYMGLMINLNVFFEMSNSNCIIFFLPAILYPRLDIGLSPRCPQVVWCHWAIFSHAGQDGLAECVQSGKNILKYSTVAMNWTRATGRTDSELFHWAIPLSYSTELSSLTALLYEVKGIQFRLKKLARYIARIDGAIVMDNKITNSDFVSAW